MPRVGLQILLESMSLVQCRKSNICLKRPGRILGRRKTPIPRVMVAKPPLQIRGRSDITLLRIVYRSKNVCVEHSIIIPQKPSAALLRVSLETATEGILRSLLLSRPLFEDGVPADAGFGILTFINDLSRRCLPSVSSGILTLLYSGDSSLKLPTR